MLTFRTLAERGCVSLIRYLQSEFKASDCVKGRNSPSDLNMLAVGRVPGQPTYSLNYSAAPFEFTLSRLTATASVAPLFDTGRSCLSFKVGSVPHLSGASILAQRLLRCIILTFCSSQSSYIKFTRGLVSGLALLRMRGA